MAILLAFFLFLYYTAFEVGCQGGSDAGGTFLGKKFPPYPLQKTLYQFVGKRFSGSVLHKQSGNPCGAPAPQESKK
jgi:hypothetical protein